MSNNETSAQCVVSKLVDILDNFEQWLDMRARLCADLEKATEEHWDDIVQQSAL